MLKRVLILLIGFLAGLAPASHAAVISVGLGAEPFHTLQAGINAASAGDTIEVSAGTYTGAAAVATIGGTKSGLTIRGVGGPVVLDAAGYSIPNGKGIFVIQGAGVTVEDIEFANATVPDNNGAGIRLEAPGVFTCDGCSFTGNENGILTYPNLSTSLFVLNSFFTDNGNCWGSSHGIYAGNIGAVTVTGSTFSGTCIGHDIKSRAATTTVTNNCLSCDFTGSASYQVEMPNGGVGVVSGNVLGKGPGADNDHFVAYAAECFGSSCHPASSLEVFNNMFMSPYWIFEQYGAVDGLSYALATWMPSIVVKVNNNVFCGQSTGPTVSPHSTGTANVYNNIVLPNCSLQVAAAPEPASFALLAVGLIGLAFGRRRS